MRALEALGMGGDYPRSQPLEVLEVDILWPRWVARIGVTRLVIKKKIRPMALCAGL